MSRAAKFVERDPSLESFWRAIILFGRNVASYKFALAQALLELDLPGNGKISLPELAEPFARHICEHLKSADKQATSTRSRFLDACRQFNRGELSKEQLRDETVRLGFLNVIDAFHVVNDGEIKLRFFTDERKSGAQGIRITDNFERLRETFQCLSFPLEVESRWRLVETAWELNLPRSVLTIGYNEATREFVADTIGRRRSVTASRDALNGYQSGTCFYCNRPISVNSGAADLAEVDHFLPHVLKPLIRGLPVDGVWNLVLACGGCNGKKSARVPELNYLVRLHARNEFLIGSHHPLRETIIMQTGQTEEYRSAFLERSYHAAKEMLIHTWHPEIVAAPII